MVQGTQRKIFKALKINVDIGMLSKGRYVSAWAGGTGEMYFNWNRLVQINFIFVSNIKKIKIDNCEYA